MMKLFISISQGNTGQETIVHLVNQNHCGGSPLFNNLFDVFQTHPLVYSKSYILYLLKLLKFGM